MTKHSTYQPPASDGEYRVSVLVVSSFEEDVIQLRRMLDQSIWSLMSSGTCQEALALLRENSVAVVICECDLPDGSWRSVMSTLSLAEHPSHLIVTSRLADEALWGEVLNLGGFNVISKPFDEQEVTWVMKSAWRQHRPRPQTSYAEV
jgi:DNA-binding response OmpR family regulator